jgi:bifunctional DNA-binding transcriptional regulator/antitoxin component of YhaV-PrlF toxin-antitoxin module
LEKQRLCSVINHHYQTEIPQEIAAKIEAKIGDELIWDYDETSATIFIIKKPQSFTRELEGLGKEIWEKHDATSYIREERTSWED